MHHDWHERDKDYQKANASKHSTVYRDIIREYVWNYLLSHTCEGNLADGSRCNENDPVVLEFHHTGEKDMAISESVTRITSIESLEEELKKTQVRCSNCHRRITARESGWFRSSK